MKTTARMYSCAGCRRQTHICSHCDRGNIYCSGECSSAARQRSMRAAGQRYQVSRAGKMNHAARQKRYRQRQQEIKVTHQGCAISRENALLHSALNQRITVQKKDVFCNFCGRLCHDSMRNQFMHRHSAFLRRFILPGLVDP